MGAPSAPLGARGTARPATTALNTPRGPARHFRRHAYSSKVTTTFSAAPGVSANSNARPTSENGTR